MATIDIRRSHTLEKDEAKKRAEELAKSMQQKLGIRWQLGGRPDPVRRAERRRQGGDRAGERRADRRCAWRSTCRSCSGP